MTATARLTLIPLGAAELALYLQGENRLETSLGLVDTGRSVIAGVRARIEKTLLPAIAQAKGDDYLFFTFWIAIEKSSRTIVAELGFKGRPDATGTIEIGYGTMVEARNQGYMTEAVAGLVAWAGSRPEVRAVVAETDEDNLASIHVLSKNGFVFFEEKGGMKWWKCQVG